VSVAHGRICELEAEGASGGPEIEGQRVRPIKEYALLCEKRIKKLKIWQITGRGAVVGGLKAFAPGGGGCL